MTDYEFVSKLRSALTYLVQRGASADDAEKRIKVLCRERDEARAAVERLTKERDEARDIAKEAQEGERQAAVLREALRKAHVK